MARAGEGQREAKERWRSFGVTRGRQREAEAKLELAGKAAGGVAPSVGGEREQRSWRKGKRTQTKFPKLSGTIM